MIAFRPAELADRPFIIGAWDESYQEANTAGMVLAANWATVMREQFRQVLDRPYVRTIVAYENEERDRIADLIGFITAEPEEKPPIVYYVYVISPQRKQGIARRLFKAAGIRPECRFDYVCSTPIVPRLAPKIPLAKWQPRRGRYSKEHRK